MNPTPMPTAQDIDALTAYLPRLYADGFSPAIRWEGGKPDKNGVIQMPYPVYDPLVNEFFRLAASECWLDYGYDPVQAGRMLKDEALIKAASLSQVRSMLTYCVRGERFSDGHWEEMITKGHIRRLLERLMEIRSKGLDQDQTRP